MGDFVELWSRLAAVRLGDTAAEIHSLDGFATGLPFPVRQIRRDLCSSQAIILSHDEHEIRGLVWQLGAFGGLRREMR